MRKRDSNNNLGNTLSLLSDAMPYASGSEGSFTLPTQGQGHQLSKSPATNTERKTQLTRSKTTAQHKPFQSSLLAH